MKTWWPFQTICIFIALLIANNVEGQSITFKRIESDKVPLSGWITSITQDKQGYLWFTSSHGLYRYDGYELVGYFHDGLNPNSIGGGNLEVVYADRDGIIWVGGQASGLDRLDPETGIFTHFKYDEEDSTSLSDDLVVAIREDHDGNLWVGTYGGLNRMDRSTGKFKRYIHDPNDPTSLSNDDVYVLYVDHQGTLWVGTGRIDVDDSYNGEGGLNRFDKATDRFIRYKNKPGDTTTLIDNRVGALFEDSYGTFWVGTFGDGLHTMNRETGTFQRYPYHPEHPERLSRPYLQQGDPKAFFFSTLGSGVSFITESGGEIWIGGNMGGINRYNPRTKKLTHFEPGTDEVNGLTDQSFISAFSTRNGILFFGAARMQGHIYEVSPSTMNLTHHPTPTPTTTFHVDRTSRLWVAAGQGAFVQDEKSGEWVRLSEEVLRESGLKELDWVSCMHDARDSSVWIGTRRGLIHYDEGKGSSTVYAHDPANSSSLMSDTITAIYEDRHENLWIGTDNGLDRFDHINKTFKHFRYDSKNPNTFPTRKVLDVHGDKNGAIWVITEWSFASGSLNRLDPTTGKVTRYPDINDLVGMASDSSGLWLASRNNLYHMDTQTGDLKRFVDPQTGEGIVAIQNLLMDDHGNLWVNTLKSLVQIHPHNHKVRRFQISGNNHVTGAYQGKRNFYQSRTGEIFFGNSTGFHSFFPEHLAAPDTTLPQIVFRNFHAVGSDSVMQAMLERTANQANTIELNHRQDGFSIGFSGIHFGQSELNKHLFKLDGYDKYWHQANSERVATYYNLSPGDYTFHVKASNGDGAWAERTLEIIIHPPWWKSWWAYGLYVAVFIFLVLAFIRYRVGVERQRQLMERKDWESQQLKKLDEIKTRFFSNVTHEFRTPLSLILPATDQLMKVLPDRVYHDKLSVIKRQAKQLLQLINQLLDLSKLEDGKMKPTLAKGDILLFTNQIVDAFRPAADEKHIKLELISSVSDTSWDFDSDKWQKITTNLISNALKFTPKGGRVKITTHLTAPGDSSQALFTFVVEDTGGGIEPDKLPLIFDRFYQADNSTTRPFDGTGIGLALVQEMIELLHGSIKVDSQVGVGTKFTVTLPVTKSTSGIEDVVAVPQAYQVEKSMDHVPLQLENEKDLPLVLVVEDHADLRDFIRDTLYGSYQILTASTGREGLVLAQEHLPDIIISDVMMPEMDGFMLTEAIKQNPETNHITVILLTAKTTQESKLSGLGVGADDYLTKPFDVDELLLRLRNSIDRQRKLHERYQHQLKLETVPLAETVQDKFWQSLCDVIESKLDDPEFDVDALATALATSRRTLYRKLATLSGLKPKEVIRDYRLKRSKQFLVSGYSVSETAYKVGFENPSYFAKCFKEIYQVTPSEYIQEYLAQIQP